MFGVWICLDLNLFLHHEGACWQSVYFFHSLKLMPFPNWLVVQVKAVVRHQQLVVA